MDNQEIKKQIKKELKQIEREYDSNDWDHKDIDKMSPDEAYNRGYFRAYRSVLNFFKEDN